MSLRMIFKTGDKLRRRWVFARKFECHLPAETRDTSSAITKTNFTLTTKPTLFPCMHLVKIYSVLSTWAWISGSICCLFGKDFK